MRGRRTDVVAGAMLAGALLAIPAGLRAQGERVASAMEQRRTEAAPPVGAPRAPTPAAMPRAEIPDRPPAARVRGDDRIARGGDRIARGGARLERRPERPPAR